MALVWLMIYFSICLMIIISICSMIIVLEWYFEITFISRKKGLCWPSVWDYLLFDIRSAQSAERFLWFSFRNDIWLSFRNEQCVPIFILKCFMTVISKWGGKIFVHRIIFVKRIGNILLTKIPHFIYFSYTVFYARLGPYPCVEIKFLKKGVGLLCQILMILRC